MKKGILIFSLFSLMFSSTSEASSKFIQDKKTKTSLQHEAKVSLKLVQVFVTDIDGNPVTDLKKTEFELYEDGKLKTITDFEIHSVQEPDDKTEGEAKEGEATPEQNLPSSMSRKYFIFLDILGNDVIGMVKGKRAALHFIDTQLQEGDEVGILSYAPMTGLTIQENLTTDYEKIRKAVKKAKEILPDGAWTSNQIAKDQQAIERERGIEGDGKYNTAIVWGLKRVARNRGDFSIDITEVAKALRYIPGYKNVILFSGGRFGGKKIIAQEFSTSNSPVFAVNTMRSHLPPKKLKQMGDDKLKILSEISGGKYFENVDDYLTIAKDIQNITRNYYVLGYYVDESWDGEFHKIEVEVKREGCLIYAQGGYLNPKPFAEFSEDEKKNHLMDLAFNDNPYYEAPLNFSMLALPFSHQNDSSLVLLSEIIVDELSEVVQGQIDVLSLIFDKQGDIEYSSSGEIDLSQISERLVFQYEFCSLEPGEYECRVVLRNSITGKGAVSSSLVNIPNESESGIKLDPPLLLIPEKKAVYLKLLRKEKDKSESATLSLNEVYPFVSNRHSPLIEMMDLGISKLLAVLRYSVINIEDPDIVFSAYLVKESSGEKIALEYRILSRKKEQGLDVLLMELPMPLLLSDSYTLEIRADEQKTKSKTQVKRTFVVR